MDSILILILANLMYGEARGEPDIGQAAVAYVLLNRVEANRGYWGGSDPLSVAEYPHQFQGYWVGEKADDSLKEKQFLIARKIIDNEIEDPTGGAVMFASAPDPSWASRYEFAIKIGNHYFWREKRKKTMMPRMSEWAKKFNIKVVPITKVAPEGAGSAFVVKDIFTTRDGSWEVGDEYGGIPQWARDEYLSGDFDDAGGEHHIFVRVEEQDGTPCGDKVVAFWSDGYEKISDPNYAGYIWRLTKSHSGWANIPIFAGSSYVPERGEEGPWCVRKTGYSESVRGIGLPAKHHISTYIVYTLIPISEYGKDYNNLQEGLLSEAAKAQVIEFNPDAALQKEIFVDGFVPNSPEFEFTFDDNVYVAQRAEHLASGLVRVYYCTKGDWDNVMTLQSDTEIT